MKRSYFKSLSDRILSGLQGAEVLTMFVEAEESDFVRSIKPKYAKLVRSNRVLSLWT